MHMYGYFEYLRPGDRMRFSHLKVILCKFIYLHYRCITWIVAYISILKYTLGTFLAIRILKESEFRSLVYYIYSKSFVLIL